MNTIIGRTAGLVPKPPSAAFTHTAVSAAPPKPPTLHVVRYTTAPYEAGKKLTVRMFVDNLGDYPLVTIGGTYSEMVDALPPDNEQRKMLERSLWDKALSLPIRPDQKSRIPVITPGLFFVELETPGVLSQPEVEKLTHAAAIYLISVQRDNTGRIRIKSCIHTVPSADSVLFCGEPSYNSDDVNPPPPELLDKPRTP